MSAAHPDEGRLGVVLELAPPAPHAVLNLVAARWGFTVDELRGPSRARRLSSARKAAVVALYDQARLTYTEIGALLGGRCHQTILWLYRN